MDPSSPSRFRPRLLPAILLLLSLAPAGADEILLGSPKFLPSPQRPVGWRGDGSGHYAGATPPITWERTAEGDGYKAKGIAWIAPLPSQGVACPIIVGEKIFLTSETSDLVCLEKRSGHLLWIRSSAEFEGLGEEDRAANPLYASKLAPLMAALERTNAEIVDALNARQSGALASLPPKSDAPLIRKHDLEKQINDEQVAIDKKLYSRYWGQGVFGFSGATPTSDGQRVYVFYTTGLTACYDLDGKRLWITRGSGGGSEHGNFASPLLCQDRLVVWANEMRGYEVATGKLAWSSPAKVSNTYGSLFRFTSGTDLVAAFQYGFFNRVRDGRQVWKQGLFGNSVSTPIVAGDTIYARVGYPVVKTEVLKAFKIPAATETGEMVPAFEFREEWADDEIPVDKTRPFERGFVASPLYVDGLIYQLTQAGGLLVNDAATGALVYRQVLPLKPKTEYWNWAGCSASPTLAGRLIYIMDNQGTALVLQPGREYKLVASNFLAELRDQKQQAQMVSTPVFEGARMYYRTPGFLYCIGTP